MTTAILIPARYGSTRFPGKPTALLDGVPLIRRVYQQARMTGFPTFVLTDDEQIADLFVEDVVYIDQTDYENGTERCAGSVEKWSRLKEYSHFINVQGDMPDVTVEMIFAVQQGLLDNSIYTLYTEMSDKLRADPNTVKMIHNETRAIWFGRGFSYGDQHLGIYGYSRSALAQYPLLRRSREEQLEKLEQLRWYQSNDIQIGVTKINFNGVEINTPGDLEEWHARRKNMGNN
jgi:3-deoxy-manno-octulosonate cytidylyltransferase (CMP-KDO synthetase)